MSNSIVTPADILRFWFSPEVQPFHFVKNEALDNKIRGKFHSVYKQALNGNFKSWLQNATGSLAHIIIFDQFPRNMFRESAQAFATDQRACVIANASIDKGFDKQLPRKQCLFLYLPFMHSESLTDQKFSVMLFKNFGSEINLKYAIAHYDIIARFGHFPHRNAALQRQSTLEEIEFLKQPGSHF